MNQQDQRKKDAHRNQQLIERELMFISHKQEFDNSSEIKYKDGHFCDLKPNQQVQPKDNQELLCACGGRCEGICRTQHLYRPRFAGAKISTNPNKKREQWAEKCPSAYEEVKHYRT